MNNRGVSITTCIKEMKNVFTAEQMDGFIWFADRFNIDYAYKAGVKPAGALCVDKMLKHAKAYKPRNYETAKMLFGTNNVHIALFRNTDYSRTFLTIHCNANGKDIIDGVNEWDEFKDYLRDHNLIFEVYEGSKFAFMSPDSNCMIVIYKKIGRANYIEDEMVRYFDLGRNKDAVTRFIYKSDLVEVTEHLKLNGHRFVTFPLVTKDIQLKYNVPPIPERYID